MKKSVSIKLIDNDEVIDSDLNFFLIEIKKMDSSKNSSNSKRKIKRIIFMSLVAFVLSLIVGFNYFCTDQVTN